MSSMKNTKEGINLKKLLRLKNTGSIFVIVGLLIILVIASYTYILQSSYTKTALETEIARDTASADAVHKLVDGKIGKMDEIQLIDFNTNRENSYEGLLGIVNKTKVALSVVGTDEAYKKLFTMLRNARRAGDFIDASAYTTDKDYFNMLVICF